MCPDTTKGSDQAIRPGQSPTDRRAGLYAGFCVREDLTIPPATAIHLGPVLPPASCGLPADSGGQPSNVRAESPFYRSGGSF